VNVPVLRNHDPDAVLGLVEFVEGDGAKVVATFKPRAITQALLLGLGGGWRILELEEVDGTTYVRRAELICLGTQNDAPPPTGSWRR
jgi:hypothetical protein